MCDVALVQLTDALRVLCETLNEFGFDADVARAVAIAEDPHSEALPAATTAAG
jgi:hypothetical protein